MNLPYFDPEDTSTKNLTDQLFKQQVIITGLLEALKDIHSALDICGKGNSKAQLLNQAKYANGRAVKAIRKFEEKNA